MQKASEVQCFVGIDVAKGKLDVHVYPHGESFVISNDDGITELIRFLEERRPKRVVFESTGGYTRKLHDELRAANIETHCVQPQRIRMYAEALGIKAKTDPIDARVIAMFAANAMLVDKPKLPESVRNLRDLVLRRVQIVGLRAREKNHKESLPEELVDGWTEIQVALDTHIRELDDAIVAFVNAEEYLQRRAAILTRIKGVGLVACSALLALLPELGQMTGKEAASLVGVAPFNAESGDSEDDRHIRGGRRRLRSALYMISLTLIRADGPLRDLYLRLIAKGKAEKVALIAVIRKFIVIANARFRDELFKTPDPTAAPVPCVMWKPRKTRTPRRRKPEVPQGG